MSRASEIAKSRAFFYVVGVGSLLVIAAVTAVSSFLPGLCRGLAEAGADCETTGRFTRVLLIAGGVAAVGEIVAIVRTQLSLAIVSILAWAAAIAIADSILFPY